jgi:hypothetical protein
MNWTEPIDTPNDEQVFVVTESTTPFAGQRRKRVLLMTLVAGGGLCLIVAMRMLSGGPTTANAGFEAEKEISGYLIPHQTQNETSTQPNQDDPLHVLAQSNGPKMRVPLHALKGNPFIVPGRLMDAPIVMSASRIDEARETRIEEMRSQVEDMRVSMVLRGRHSVAVVGSMSLPLNSDVDFDERTQIRLISLDGRGVVVRATDTELGASVDIELPRP